ncbi:hypothetical protein ACN28I_32455 [Archangium gephyra]|uniref:hypothetical protein n=1 Tax=Archangium gephyra TaxID=48 RepID=UPI003B7E42FA
MRTGECGSTWASRKSGTCCELLLRKALWRRGLRYRVDDRNLPGRPDIMVACTGPCGTPIPGQVEH